MSKEIDQTKKWDFAFCIHSSPSENKIHYSKKKKIATLYSREIEQKSQEPEATTHQWADLYLFITLPRIAVASAKDKLLRKTAQRKLFPDLQQKLR